VLVIESEQIQGSMRTVLGKLACKNYTHQTWAMDEPGKMTADILYDNKTQKAIELHSL
jgi:hypothetical protein